MEIIAFIVTFLVSLIGTSIFGTWLNWSEAGVILAICTMGSFILWSIRHPKEK